MNVTEITLVGPVMENLCQVTISDEHDNDSLHLDNAEVEEAKAAGHEAVLALVLDNCGRGGDILRAARDNGTDVILDGENVSPEALRSALAGPAAPTA